MPVRRQRMSYSRKAKRGKSPARKLTKRKTPTKKRKTTKRKSTKAVDPNLASYVNPFSNLTSQPKIPDGKPSESVGLTFRDVTQVIQASPANPVMFALVPALGYCCIVQNDQTSQVIAGPDEIKTNVRQFTDAPGSFDISGIAGGPVPDGTTVAHDTTDVAHWRMVSAGLRISLLNAAEEDDGWWEATNFIIDDEARFWGIIPRLTDSSENSLLTPNGQIFNNRNTDFSNTRGYQTGLLRDLHKHVFRCKPCMEDHDFHDLRGDFRLDAGEMEFTPGPDYLQFQPGSQTFRDMSKELVDNSFQITLIRCYGRGQDPPSRFHVDSQANYEFIYSREANESKFHTAAAFHDDFKNVTTGLRRDPTPGVVMSM